MMQPCDDRIAALVDAAAGELDADARAGLEAHVATCAGCREELASMSRVETMLAKTRDEPDDFQLAGFAPRTAERAERFRDRSVRGLWWSLTRGPRLAIGFSSAALAASLVLFAVARTAPAPHETGARVPEEVAALATADSDLADDELAGESAVNFEFALDVLTNEELDALAELLDQDPS